jgi:DNA end-binding protein Ku
MARPTFSGYLRLNLVSVPIDAYTAAQPEGGKLRFHQLHAPCHSRIRYSKVCPIHGEVSNDEIVSGYEFAKDQYVVLDKAETQQARATGERTIELEKFIAPAEFDPIWFNGSDYYLLPAGTPGQKPYALLYRAMIDEERQALGRATLWGRDYLVLVRPYERLLLMSILKFASQLRMPKEFQDQAPEMKLSADELKLGRMLIEATSAEADLASYRDTYTDRLKELVDAKLEGREVVETHEEESPSVINLMDALRQSVERAHGKPAKKIARHARGHHESRSSGRRRKSS